MKQSPPASVIVVGAGLAGLLAARTLQEAGSQVTLLEKGQQVGGRMASREIALGAAQATFDHGAQYFTVRTGRFRAWVSRWQAEGIVHQWSNGFATPDASAYRDGHPRYRGVPTMAAIPHHLARTLDVQLESAVSAVTFVDGWQVKTTAGAVYRATAVVLTPPVPQSLALLGGVTLTGSAQQALARINYDPCLAVLAVLDGPSSIPEPGGLWPGSRLISWMADNRQKGISDVPAVTIHGSPEFSKAHYDHDDDEVARLLLAESAPLLGRPVLSYQVKRWRYSIPVQVHHRRCLALSDPGPLIFAGDAFAGPRVEGAALSGLAAADQLLARGTAADSITGDEIR